MRKLTKNEKEQIKAEAIGYGIAFSIGLVVITLLMMNMLGYL